MANALTFTPPNRKKNNIWLKAILTAFVIVLLFSLIILYWYSRAYPRVNVEIEHDLMALLKPGQVPADLVLLTLADYPPEQVWEEALARKQWDGALALWLFSPLSSDRQSIEYLLELAEAQQQDNLNAAAAYLLAAADVTRISPELDDHTRAELIVIIGKKLYSLGLTVAAVTEWRQASILAHYSPAMPSMYRTGLIQDLVLLYKQAGAERLETRARQDAAQVNTSSGDDVALPERILLDTEELPPEPTPLQAARDKRRLTAQQAAKELDSSLEAFAYSELNDALNAEAHLHRQWITEELKQPHSREEQAALLIAHINWLQRLRLLAWEGSNEFSSWIEQRAQIELDLHEAWNALELVRLDQSIREGIQERATLAQRDWWATRLIQARLNRDPKLDLQQIISSMLPNNADAAGNDMLRLDWIEGRFWRIPQQYVGTNQVPD